MPSIGSETFLSVRGLHAPAGERVETITRPGVDGHAYRLRGRRGGAYEADTLSDHPTAADADAKLEACLALQGRAVSVEDDRGRTHGVMVLACEPRSMRRVIAPVGGGGPDHAWWLRIGWRLRTTEGSP